MNNQSINTAPQDNVMKRLGYGVVAVAAVLMIPFLTNMPWTGFDYIFAGMVLSACAIIYVLATQHMRAVSHRVAVAAGILLFIFLVIGWAASGP